MEKSKMQMLFLMGMTAGLMMSSQSGLEATQEALNVDPGLILVKAKCKAHGGCEGFTATRDVKNASIQNEEKLEKDDSDKEDHDIHEDDDESDEDDL